MTNHTLGMMSCYPKGIDQTELNIIDAMIRAALVEGISLGVFDGEEWAVRNSTDYQEITGEIAATDATTLRLRDSGGAKIGDIILIYGNGEDVIHDHTDNPITGRIVNLGQAAAN